mmetsp:Transcript_68108/g.176917  ORF Transcript_68108/g.176917 Transcript_68108/m.176917 type:complete len:185 (-) Transcript_68108:295-849(-)
MGEELVYTVTLAPEADEATEDAAEKEEVAEEDIDDPFAMMSGMGEEEIYKVTLVEEEGPTAAGASPSRPKWGDVEEDVEEVEEETLVEETKAARHVWVEDEVEEEEEEQEAVAEAEAVVEAVAQEEVAPMFDGPSLAESMAASGGRKGRAPVATSGAGGAKPAPGAGGRSWADMAKKGGGGVWG